MRINLFKTAMVASALMVIGGLRPCAVAADHAAWATRGRIGRLRVGVDVAVRPDDHTVVGHYFYGTQLKDIPLTGTKVGPNLVLHEPGGAVFTLQLRSSDPNQPPPSRFDNAVMLVGTWRSGPTTLPVRLENSNSWFDPDSREPRYDNVTTETDAAYEARIARFLKAVLGNDRRTAAGMVTYPLTVNTDDPFTIHGPADLIRYWGEVFTPKVVQALREEMPHEMWTMHGMTAVANGTVWFGGKGARAVNPGRRRDR